jgi:hypothetical protein
MSPTGNRLVVVGLILGLCGSGIALGVALDRFVLRPTPSRPAAEQAPERPRLRGEAREKLLVDRFKAELGLDEAQTRLTAAQIHLMFSELDTIRARTRAELKKVRESRRSEILKVLRPEQQSRFREMIGSYEERRARRHRQGREGRR